VLRPFTDADMAPFAELNAHPLVVESLGSSPWATGNDAAVDAVKVLYRATAAQRRAAGAP
jgi:hypothetical protein